MIRIILTITKFIIGIVVAIAFASCQFNATKGNREVVSTPRNVDTFTNIVGEGGIDIVVTMAPQESVVVEADSNLHKLIKTEVKNGTLYISADGNIIKAKSFKVLVTMPTVSVLAVSGGSTLTSKNVMRSDVLHLKSNSGSEMKLNVEVDSLFCESSSGSEIDINGKALHFESTSSSGSDINAKKLLANTVIAQSSSGSSTDVHAIVSLNAKANSGSDISYYGQPKNLVVKESSGASIAKK